MGARRLSGLEWLSGFYAGYVVGVGSARSRLNGFEYCGIDTAGSAGSTAVGRSRASRCTSISTRCIARKQVVRRGDHVAAVAAAASSGRMCSMTPSARSCADCRPS